MKRAIIFIPSPERYKLIKIVVSPVLGLVRILDENDTLIKVVHL